MRKRFLQALEGARRSRPGEPFEVLGLSLVSLNQEGFIPDRSPKIDPEKHLQLYTKRRKSPQRKEGYSESLGRRELKNGCFLLATSL